MTGGRIVDFAVVEREPWIFYAATATGGAWKTENGGFTWKPVFEREKTVALGGIAVSDANPNVVWVGTGEPNARNLRGSSWGNGVYKSEDGGNTWQHMGLEFSQHIGRIVIHPSDPNVVWVAVLGSLWTHQPERNQARGLWKTTDGGRNWTRSLWVDDRTGVVELALDPRNPDRLYAGAWQRERTDWRFFATGPGSGLYRSEDGGENWTRLANGLPESNTGRPGLSVCRSRPDRVYAILEGKEGGLYRSDDRGASWERKSDEVSSSMYYGQVRCDPNQPDRVYVLSTQMAVSDDGGSTFRFDGAPSSVHVDHHALWISPERSEHMLLGNDGGIYQSEDGGRSWRFAPNLPLTQFYNVTADLQEPFYYVYGGTQDNNSLGGPSGTRNTDGVVNADWFVTVGGDGFWLAVDPGDPKTVYTESQYGRLTRFDTKTGERRLIQPQPPRGQDEEDELEYRWNWSAPVLISPHNPRTIYFGAQFLFRSLDRGDSWEVASADLTRELEYGPENLISPYGTIRVIAESPLRQGVLAVGTDDGLIQLTRDGGAAWTEIGSFPGVPELSQVMRLVLSAHDSETIYAAFSGHENNDFHPYLLRSSDFGETWTAIANGIPADEPIRAFAEDPEAANLLFLGTEFGVYATLDAGGTWVSLQNDLPTVPLHDMVIQPQQRDLVLGTHGRGFWVLDQIDVLREMSDGIDPQRLHIFSSRAGLQLNRFDRGKGNQGDAFFRAANPPDGVIVDYWIPEVTAEESDEVEGGEVSDEPGSDPAQISLEVLDSSGGPVRRLVLEEEGSEGGLHRLVWDMRHDPTYLDPENDRRNVQGPWVVPGVYEIRLTVAGEAVTNEVRVLADPAMPLAKNDREYWHGFQLAAAQTLGKTRAAVASARETISTLDGAKTALEQTAGAPAALRERVDTLKDRASELVEELEEVERAASGVYSNVRRSTALPTQDQEAGGTWAAQRLEELVERLRTLMEEELPTLAEELREAGAPWTPNQVETELN
ncbi:WD40/YVTN/BNR-like repeat-containing protein [Gemmatimonadota bacterium]